MSDRFAADLPKDVNADTRSSAGTTIAQHFIFTIITKTRRD